jgi:hypothetical protein
MDGTGMSAEVVAIQCFLLFIAVSKFFQPKCLDVKKSCYICDNDFVANDYQFVARRRSEQSLLRLLI